MQKESVISGTQGREFIPVQHAATGTNHFTTPNPPVATITFNLKELSGEMVVPAG